MFFSTAFNLFSISLSGSFPKKGGAITGPCAFIPGFEGTSGPAGLGPLGIAGRLLTVSQGFGPIDPGPKV